MNTQIVHAAMIKKASQNKQAGVDDILKALGKGADNVASWAKGLFGKKKVPQIDMNAIRNNAFIKHKAPGVKDLTPAENVAGFGWNDVVEQAKRIGDSPEDIKKFQDARFKDLGAHLDFIHQKTDIGKWNREHRSMLPRLDAYENTVNDIYANDRKLQEALRGGSSSKMKLSPDALSSKAGLTQPGPFSHVDDQTFRQNLRNTAESNADKLEEAAKDFYWRQYNKQVPLIDDTAARPLPKDSYPWSNLKRLRVEELAQKRDAAIDNVKKYSDLMRTNGGKVNIKDLINSGALKSYPK